MAVRDGRVKEVAKKAKAQRRDALPEVKPVATSHVLQIINSMDVLLRYAQSVGMSVGDVAVAFLAEVDAGHPIIADRLRATLPMMQTLGRIAGELSVVIEG